MLVYKLNPLNQMLRLQTGLNTGCAGFFFLPLGSLWCQREHRRSTHLLRGPFIYELAYRRDIHFLPFQGHAAEQQVPFLLLSEDTLGKHAALLAQETASVEEKDRVSASWTACFLNSHDRIIIWYVTSFCTQATNIAERSKAFYSHVSCLI